VLDKVVVASMAVEGGGETLYGRQVDGVWSFWREWSSMDIDDDGNESWPSWSSEPVPDLLAALPEDEYGRKLFLRRLVEVHPLFSDQLRAAYEQYVGSSKWRKGWWEELLASSEERRNRQ
jgi:hypothetical protein